MKKAKNTKKVESVLTEEHHRRPRSLDGSDDPSNISYVRSKPHKEWHVLFGNLNAEQICNTINLSPWKPEGVFLECRFINGDPVHKKGKGNSNKVQKCHTAWDSLFSGLNFSQVVSYINNVWLDPSYHFYVIENDSSE